MYHLLLVGLIQVANLIAMKFSTKRAFIVVSSFLVCFVLFICDVKTFFIFLISKQHLSLLPINLVSHFITTNGNEECQQSASGKA